MIARPTLSAIVITRDEAARIERCLRSVDFADEVVVVDSGSSDATVDLARACGARVSVHADWPGFGRQKNRALALATGDWVLSIDADEVVTPRLREAILAAIRAPGEADAFWLRRRSCFAGKPLRFGDWSGDRVLRLFRRGAARFTDDLVHERLDYDRPAPVLDGWLMHYTIDSLADALEKGRRYAAASWMAASACCSPGAMPPAPGTAIASPAGCAMPVRTRMPAIRRRTKKVAAFWRKVSTGRILYP